MYLCAFNFKITSLISDLLKRAFSFIMINNATHKSTHTFIGIYISAPTIVQFYFKYAMTYARKSRFFI